MKIRKFKLLSLLACAFAALSFTSCLSDDDGSSNSGLTAEQVQLCYQATKGSYYGKMVYKKDPAQSSVSNNDTVSVSWSILTDSTMTIHEVPSKAIASAISNKELQEAIAEQPDKDINCAIAYYSLSNGTGASASTQYVTWLVNPLAVTYDNVSYGGATHKVQIVFYINNTYSFGTCNTSTRKSQMQVIMGGVYVDGKYNSSLMSSTGGVALYFYN